ncbi:hypothetical protein Trydic_g4756 [Trypoxylus dichotomus]
MNKWKIYGSVSDLVKQFETVKPQNTTVLKKFQSTDDVKKLHDFQNIYDKFENQDATTQQSNLTRHETTNHLECLQLQELKQVRNKLYSIVLNLDVKADPGCLENVGQLILDAGNVCDYGHASIKCEKAELLPLLHRYYLYIRDKMKREKMSFDEGESLPWLIGKDGLGDKKLPPNPPLRLKELSSGSNGTTDKLGNEVNGSKEIKRIIIRKYEKNPTIQTSTSNHDTSKKTSIISRKISKLQAASGQDVQLRPKTRTLYSQQIQDQADNRRNTWHNTESSSGTINNRYKPVYYTNENFQGNFPAPTPRYGSSVQRSKSFNAPKASEDFDQSNRWDTTSNSSEYGSKRYSWYGYRGSPDLPNSYHDKCDTESDTTSIVSGHDMFAQKYSGVADKINNVLKKQISKLEGNGLMN